ncbi:MAG: hypothetical protein GTO35_09095, partial [Gammaproteobacteria bacterium]|nr:hypothetical protein [Gammaproteobacteria bacterium]
SEFYVSIPFKKCDKVLEHGNVSNLDGLHILLVVPAKVEESILRQYLEYWHAEVKT